VSNQVDSSDLPQQFGPYTLLRRLAVGGMAEVYVAKTRGIGGFEKRVALKLIHPRFSEDAHFIQMLVSEAKLSVLLTHRNIVQTFDLGSLERTYFIVMEYVEGADCFSLTKRIRAHKKDLPFDVCAYIMAEVCSGLDYAHRRRSNDGRALNIVHRDISPQNVLISFAGEVKIADFGIAKFAMREEETLTGVIKGKYHYMSPEQSWGDPTDRRSDIFSAGIVLYEMLTGDMLYQTGNIPLLLDMVRKAEIPPPNTRRADVPWELTDIVMRAVAKRPGDRYQSAHDMSEALRRYLDAASPSFSSERLSSLMGSLFQEEAQSSVAPFPSRPPSLPPPLLADGPKTIETVDIALPIMSRDEFEPDPHQSVIFSLSELERPPSAKPVASPVSAAQDRATFRPPAFGGREKVNLAGAPKLPAGLGAPAMPAAASFAGSDQLDFDDATSVDDGAARRALEAISSARLPSVGMPHGAAASVRPAPSLGLLGLGNREEESVVTRPHPMQSQPSAAVMPPLRDLESSRRRDQAGVFVPDAQQGATDRVRAIAVPPRRPWLIPAVVVVVAVLASLGAGWLLRPLLRAAPVLEVASSPAGASIRIDGNEIAQRTPATVQGRLKRGERHRLEVRLEGYEPWAVEFTADSPVIHQTATLRSRSTP
jgi:serine/threonine protein kinase